MQKSGHMVLKGVCRYTMIKLGQMVLKGVCRYTIIKLGQMVLKGVYRVHKDKVRSNGLERSQFGTQ